MRKFSKILAAFMTAVVLTAVMPVIAPVTAQCNPSNIATAYNIHDVTTIGGANGSIKVFAYDLDALYASFMYRIQREGGEFSAWQAANIFSNLTKGGYTVEARQETSGVVASEFMVVNDMSDYVTTDATTHGGADGTITVNAWYTDVDGYKWEYSIDNTDWQTSRFFNNLSAGTYTVATHVSYGGTTDITNFMDVTIGQPQLVNVGISCVKNDVTTYSGADGSITVTASGGNSGSYEYSINGGAWQSSNTFGGLSTGTYTVAVCDAENISNSASDSVTIGQPELVPVGISCVKSDVTTYGGADGSITVTASGGNSGTYQYSINGGAWQSSNTFGGLSTGTYTVAVCDAENISNSASDSVTIGQPDPVPVGISCVKSDVTTYGGADGSITVTASGGNSGTYQYSINGGAWQSSNTFSGLSTGTYTVAVCDAENISNSASDSVTIGQPDPLPVGISCANNDVTIYGEANGSITVTASGGNSGIYQYSINDGAWQSSNTFNGLSAGTYTVTVRDAGNTSNYIPASVTIGQPRNLGDLQADKLPGKVNFGEALKIIPPQPRAPYTLKSVSYSTSNSSIATVDTSGNVVFLGHGKVTITTTVVFQMTDKKGKVNTTTTVIKKIITVG